MGTVSLQKQPVLRILRVVQALMRLCSYANDLNRQSWLFMEFDLGFDTMVILRQRLLFLANPILPIHTSCIDGQDWHSHPFSSCLRLLAGANRVCLIMDTMDGPRHVFHEILVLSVYYANFPWLHVCRYQVQTRIKYGVLRYMETELQSCRY